MKRLGFLLFFIVFLAAFPSTGEASSQQAKIYLDGEQLNLASDVKVVNMDNSILIPIRVVSENLGYQVGWNKAAQTVTVSSSSTLVQMSIGSLTADINGSKVTMAAKPILSHNSTLVPLRFVSDQMGLNVKWDNEMKAVFLTSGGPIETPGPDSGAVPGTNPVTSPGSNPGEVPFIPSFPGNPDVLAEVDGISFSENRMYVAFTGSVKPKVMKLTKPDRLVIDLENTAFSTSFSANNNIDATLNGMLTPEGYPDVKSIRYSFFNNNPSTIRIVLDLDKPANYSLAGTESGSSLLVVDLNATAAEPAPELGSSGKKVVVIDAGHGSQDGGAVSVTNKREKDFNLAIALKVGKLLEKESAIDVVLTRSDDTFLELKDRAKMANNLNADVFVSIHGNSGQASASGTETYYYTAQSKPLAQIMHKHLLEATNFKDRKVKQAKFVVIRETKMPAVLLEVGFLSNKNEATQMFKEDFQNRVAQGIVDGIKEYLKL